ncbi:tripartite tricarboxylate transporter substrate binding protein [Ramlibacter sp. AW1]|uniref:Tripartite tricarboxylate transporter substrate binding protein n=1 Tax=Ramlibacter aurantiacus TaxID=2801330 RepID=A0A937D4K0_9BURK|nr:tripartite tricarboxylate transporter substrate binding protein [Ramlibacter aurantiacus]MBL0418973.1 tripartite tricarboxylate transporter substrate binding protein [Ramlibacter aurantiacus]
MPLRRSAIVALSTVAAMAALAPGWAQGQPAPAWPTKTIRIMVGSPPGGPSDITTRLFAEQLQQRTGQPVVVENRPGAGNNLAAQVVAQSEADGHTLVLSPDTVVTTNPLVYRNMPFDPRKDLVNVSILAGFTQLLVCNPKVQARSVSELIALAKARPMTYASGGPAVPGHLATEMLLQRTGARMQHIPYKGPAPATLAVLSGEVDCGFLATPTVMQHVKAGKLNALAVSSAQPSPLAPDVPTLPKALNQPDLDITFKLVLQARRGTPPAVIAALEKHAAEIMQRPDIRARLQASDLTPVGSTSAQAEATVREDSARWEPVVKQLGLTME